MLHQLDLSACAFVQTSYCPLGVQSWRGDGRCGDGYKFPNGCDAYSHAGYCCSLLTHLPGQINHGWCGDNGKASPGGKDHCRPGTDFRTHAPGGGTWRPPALRNVSCATTVTADFAGFCVCGNALDTMHLEPFACGHRNITCLEHCGMVPSGGGADDESPSELSTGGIVAIAIAAMVGIVCVVTLGGLSISLLVVYALAKLGWAEGAHAADPAGSRWKRRAARLGAANPPAADDVWDGAGNTRATALTAAAGPGDSPVGDCEPLSNGERRRRRRGAPVPRSETSARAFPTVQTTAARQVAVLPYSDDDERDSDEPDALETLLLSQAATISRLELQCMRLSGQMETTGSGALPRLGPGPVKPATTSGRRPNLGLSLPDAVIPCPTSE